MKRKHTVVLLCLVLLLKLSINVSAQESIIQNITSPNIESNEVVGYCEDIGCSQLERFNYADANNFNYSYTRYIKESSFCAIATHGYKYGIQWSMRGIYNGHTNCQNPSCTTCYGWYTTDYLDELPNDYFSNTRCVVSTACETAKGGKLDLTNFVNVLHSKGVQTVVGFEEETWFFYKTTIEANLNANGKYTKYDLENGLIPEKIETEEIRCGLDSYCVIGDGCAVVKH